MIRPVAGADDRDTAAKQLRIQGIGSWSEKRKRNGIRYRDHAYNAAGQGIDDHVGNDKRSSGNTEKWRQKTD
jgi:hypothetical protein